MPQGQTGSLIRGKNAGYGYGILKNGLPLEGPLADFQPLQEGLLVFPQEKRSRAILKLPRFSTVETDSYQLFVCLFTSRLGRLNLPLQAEGGLPRNNLVGDRAEFGPLSHLVTLPYIRYTYTQCKQKEYEQITHGYTNAIHLKRFPFTKT